MTEIDTIIWQPAPEILPLLDANTVHIWLILQQQAPITVDMMYQHLSADEKSRAAKYHTVDLRHHYIMCHAALRQILSRYLNLSPVTIAVEADEWGKPYLVGSTLQFNLSHSGKFAIVGMIQMQPLGIDIEAVELLPDMAEVAQHHFSPAEQADLFALPADTQLTAFYKCWTRKEAYIKADGRGLGIALDSFDVTLDDKPKIRRIDDNREITDWTLLDLPVPDGYCGALAIRQPIHQIFTWLF